MYIIKYVEAYAHRTATRHFCWWDLFRYNKYFFGTFLSSIWPIPILLRHLASLSVALRNKPRSCGLKQLASSPKELQPLHTEHTTSIGVSRRFPFRGSLGLYSVNPNLTFLTLKCDPDWSWMRIVSQGLVVTYEQSFKYVGTVSQLCINKITTPIATDRLS